RSQYHSVGNARLVRRLHHHLVGALHRRQLPLWTSQLCLAAPGFVYRQRNGPALCHPCPLVREGAAHNHVRRTRAFGNRFRRLLSTFMKYCFLACFALAATTLAALAATNPAIIPLPAKVDLEEGTFSL